jgi:hypothetical protein
MATSSKTCLVASVDSCHELSIHLNVRGWETAGRVCRRRMRQRALVRALSLNQTNNCVEQDAQVRSGRGVGRPGLAFAEVETVSCVPFRSKDVHLCSNPSRLERATCRRLAVPARLVPHLQPRGRDDQLSEAIAVRASWREKAPGLSTFVVRTARRARASRLKPFPPRAGNLPTPGRSRATRSSSSTTRTR